MNLDDIKGTPFERMLMDEQGRTIIVYGSLCSMIFNRRLGKQHVLGIMIKDKRYMDLLTKMLSADNARETI